MFDIKWTPEAAGLYKELCQRAETTYANRKKKAIKKSSKIEGLFKQIRKTILYLSKNPRHPSLNTHEFHDIPHPYNDKEKIFEAYVQSNTSAAYRVFWCYGPHKNEITIITITQHP
jgi:hypothetical protein